MIHKRGCTTSATCTVASEQVARLQKKKKQKTKGTNGISEKGWIKKTLSQIIKEKDYKRETDISGQQHVIKGVRD